eukprot:3023431-Rhodomonas_salina.6
MAPYLVTYKGRSLIGRQLTWPAYRDKGSGTVLCGTAQTLVPDSTTRFVSTGRSYDPRSTIRHVSTRQRTQSITGVLDTTTGHCLGRQYHTPDEYWASRRMIGRVLPARTVHAPSSNMLCQYRTARSECIGR